MPRNLAAAVEKSFQKGLITEATGLNFPENAVTETVNCRFNQIGSVSRRKGLNYETGFTTQNTNRNRSTITEYIWNAVAGDGEINFAVIQIGKTIYFYGVSSEGTLSTGLKDFTINLENHKVAGSPLVKTKTAQFASGKGYLFVSHPYCDPFYVEYLPDDDDIDIHPITIEIRDFEGVDDGLKDAERPRTLSVEHNYNLWNQGWADGVDGERQGSRTVNPITFWYSETGKDYPSNCDVWWLYKDELEAYRPQERKDSFGVGNTPAPKGHFILRAFFEDRSSMEGGGADLFPGGPDYTLPGLDVITSKFHRPQTIAFFAGRVWYAGVDFQGYSSKIWYSQILDQIDHIGKCYQREDPTAEDQSDLLDSDGGVIEIQEIGTIIKLFTIKSAVLVFASNGVWIIGGTQNSGFTATDFQISKLSSIPTITERSFVDVFGTPVWWNLDGIYTLSQGSSPEFQTGPPEIKSITDDTIKQFYDAIPTSSKRYAKGAVNQTTKEVQWLYNSKDVFDAPGDHVDDAYNYNSVLCLNTLTGAFYPWKIDITSGVHLNGLFCNLGLGITFQNENVTDNAANFVLDHLGANVTTPIAHEQEFAGLFRYLVSTQIGHSANYRISFALEEDTQYKDWGLVDYGSYFISGFKIRGNALNFGQTPYIISYTLTETGASCFLQVLWDYATSTNTNRIGRWNQICRAKPGYSVQEVRTKLRGKGRVVQMKYFSESGKPFTVIGWASLEAVNAQP